MDKRYINGILIVFLIAIWGSVIYKYFVKKTMVLPDDNAYGNVNPTVHHTIAKDTFTLVLNDRDPFKVSRRSMRVNKPLQSKKVATAAKRNKSIKSSVWPRIEYYGFVKSTQNQTKMALIKVNGRLHRKREKETVDELRILKAYGDSITVSFNEDEKTIKRK